MPLEKVWIQLLSLQLRVNRGLYWAFIPRVVIGLEDIQTRCRTRKGLRSDRPKTCYICSAPTTKPGNETSERSFDHYSLLLRIPLIKFYRLPIAINAVSLVTLFIQFFFFIWNNFKWNANALMFNRWYFFHEKGKSRPKEILLLWILICNPVNICISYSTFHTN